MISLLRPLFYAGLLVAVARGDSTFKSGSRQVALIELYTSEGCSSCPPAEEWLGKLSRTDGLWRDFVPVAFHVNYWDHLGWRDVLASKAYTDREYTYSAAWGASSVYTPCFVRNGAEWRPSDLKSSSDSTTAAAGTLALTWQPESRTCRIDYTPAPSSKNAPAGKAVKPLDISVALLGSGIVSQVRKGENAGRELHHDFVALRLETTGLKQTETGNWSATVSLPPRSDIKASRTALAAWVTKQGQSTPLQAAGGWIE